MPDLVETQSYAQLASDLKDIIAKGQRLELLSEGLADLMA